MLEDHADPLPPTAELTGREAGELRVVEEDTTRRRALEQVEATDERALAGTAVADDAEHLTLGDLQGDPLQRLDPLRAVAERLDELLGAEQAQFPPATGMTEPG